MSRAISWKAATTVPLDQLLKVERFRKWHPEHHAKGRVPGIGIERCDGVPFSHCRMKGRCCMGARNLCDLGRATIPGAGGRLMTCWEVFSMEDGR